MSYTRRFRRQRRDDLLRLVVDDAPCHCQLPTHCEVCDAELDQGETCRLLADTAGGSVYGHAACIDQLVAERVKLGQTYLGDRTVR